MESFLKISNLPKLTQEETDNLNRSISIKGTESIVNFPQQKAADPECFTGKFYQILRK